MLPHLTRREIAINSIQNKNPCTGSGTGVFALYRVAQGKIGNFIRLTFNPLEFFARAFLPWFFTFLHAGIAAEQVGFL